MKKFLATLLVGAVSVAGVLGFTACGGDEGETPDGTDKEVVTTVTAKEWEVAMALPYDGKHNVQFKAIEQKFPGDGSTVVNIWYGYFDVANEANYYERGNMDEATEYTIRERDYCWKSGDKYYGIGRFWGEKQEISKADYENNLKDKFDYFDVNRVFPGISEKYNEFSYDEASKEYKLTERGMDYTVKFENGKLIKYTDVRTNGTIDTLEIKYENVKITIPQDILNAPVSKED